MPESIQTIATDFTRRVGKWLSQPDEASTGLTELRDRLEALRGTIGSAAASEALKSLQGAERTIQTSRQKEAATVIAASLRELGIRVEPGAPLKRTPRKKAAKPAAPQEAEQASAPSMGEGSSDAAPAASDARGFLQRRKAQ